MASVPEEKPAIKQPIFENIPDEMRRERRFCVWRFERRGTGGKRIKVPYNAVNGTRASSTDSKTWTSFQQVRQTFECGDYEGIGFFLGGGFVGVDLDDCRNPESGKIDAWAQSIMERLSAYCGR